MKNEFTIFSNRLTVSHQEVSNISSRVSLLEEQSHSEIDLGTKMKISLDRPIPSPVKSYTVLRSGRHVEKKLI